MGPYLSEQYVNATNHPIVSQQSGSLSYVDSCHTSPHLKSRSSVGAYPSNLSAPVAIGNMPVNSGSILSLQTPSGVIGPLQNRQFKAYNVSYPVRSDAIFNANGGSSDSLYEMTLDSLPPPHSRSVPLLDFSSLSNTSSAIPSTKTESKFQEGIKMLDADIQKLQNSIQQLFTVGQK